MAETFFHVDLDAFYASVEQLDNPEYRGKPVIVGARPGTRGVVAACSYEARTFGVRSAMPISEAHRRCPQGVYVRPRMERYAELSGRVMRIFDDFTPSVRRISIDEASLDMTGTETLFGPPKAAAERLKRRVREETGLSLSVGIAENRFLAKMASEFRKPDGLYEVLHGEEEAFVDAVGLEKIWGVGRKTLERLKELRLDTTGKVREKSERHLASLFGNAAGAFLSKAVRGIDPGMYSETAKSHSVSSETTFLEDTGDRELIDLALLDLSHQVMFRLFEEEGRSKSLGLKIRYADFSTYSRRTTLGHYITSAEELHLRACELLREHWDGGPLRLVGIGLEQVETEKTPIQGELFSGDFDKRAIVERTVLSLKKRNPDAAPVKASLLERGRNSPKRRKDPDPSSSPGS